MRTQEHATARTAAVVRGAKDRHERSFIPKLIAVFYDHVGATNEVKVVLGQKLLNDFLPKAVADATFVVLPIESCITRIGPEEIIEQAVVRDICWTLDPSNIVHV